MKNKKYQINQSPLYKLTTHAKLANCLGFKDQTTLKSLLKRGDNNYYVSSLANGRVIEVPKQQLARVHNRINSLLTRLETPDYLYSGVKGRSNIHNARKHIGCNTVLKIDIKKFYPSVTTEQIARCFVKQFKCTLDVAETLAQLCVVDDHLPTGSSISQSLAFAVNRPVFDHIDTYSRARGIKFTCYVDDLTFSSPVLPEDFCSYVVNYIKRNRNYICHKIRRHNVETPKSITGAIIDGHVLKVKNKHRNRISRLLHIYNFMVKRYKVDADELIIYFQRLQGHLFSAGQINPRYRQLGKVIVARRSALGVKALNQNTK